MQFIWTLVKKVFVLPNKLKGRSKNQQLGILVWWVQLVSQPQQTFHILASWEQGRWQLIKEHHMIINLHIDIYFFEMHRQLHCSPHLLRFHETTLENELFFIMSTNPTWKLNVWAIYLTRSVHIWQSTHLVYYQHKAIVLYTSYTALYQGTIHRNNICCLLATHSVKLRSRNCSPGRVWTRLLI